MSNFPLQTDDAELIYSFIQRAYMGFGTVFVTIPKYKPYISLLKRAYGAKGT